jgi:hypothetical protein
LDSETLQDTHYSIPAVFLSTGECNWAFSAPNAAATLGVSEFHRDVQKCSEKAFFFLLSLM